MPARLNIVRTGSHVNTRWGQAGYGRISYFPLVMIYMNITPAMTIKPNTIRPIFPFRLSSFISQIKKPTKGIRKIRKKIILGVLNIIERPDLFVKGIKIKNTSLQEALYPARRSPSSNIYNTQQLRSLPHYQCNIETEE